MQKNKIMPTVVLCAICIVTVALLALVNLVTGPQIAANQEENANQALREVMSDGKEFEKLGLEGLPEAVTGAYKSDNGGYVFQMTVVGYKPGLVIMCGINSDGQITGSKCIASSETMDVEYTLGDLYIGRTKSDYIDVVSSATAKLTKNGYQSAVKAAFEAFEILNGGEK